LRPPLDPVRAAFFSRSKAYTLLKVEIGEVWSDQFPGVEVNKLPGESGHQGRPYLKDGGEEYLIVGPKSENTISLKVKFDAPDISELRDKINFDIRVSSSPIIDYFIPSPTTTTIDWSSKIATVEHDFDAPGAGINAGNDAEFLLRMYIDLNGNDRLDSESEVLVTSRLSNGDSFHLKFAHSQNYTNTTILGVLGGVYGQIWENWPDAANLLDAFATGNVPSGAIDLNTTISISGDSPSHNNGVVFNNSGSGPSSNYVFDALSDMSERVLDSADLARHIRKVLDTNYDAVVSAFARPENENEPYLVLGFPISSYDQSIGFSLDGNLFRTFGTASISGTIEAVIHKLEGPENDLYQVDSVGVDANVTDLYDWDYNKGGDYDKPFALLQGGFNTLGSGGRIFKIRTRLDGNVLNLSHFITPIQD